MPTGKIRLQTLNYAQIPLLLRVEYLHHQRPFLGRGGSRVAALELAYVGFPFGLAGKGGEPCHVTVPVEVVHGVHYHEQAAALGVDLHREYAYGVLAGYDFGPDARMYLYVFLDQFGVVFQCQGLAIAFHTVELFQTLAVPLEQPLDPVLDLDLVGPAEGVELAYVDELAHCAVYVIALVQKEFGKIRSVLTGDAGNQCFFIMF